MMMLPTKYPTLPSSRLHRTILMIAALLFLLSGCTHPKAHYLIGVSQCSDDEWRRQMNRELLREALFFPETQVEIRTAHDDNGQQIKDIEALIAQGVDLLVVAPNEAEAITPVIEKAFKKGIPVILADRSIHSDQFTAYVGADNYAMGRQIGQYIRSCLHDQGRIVELTGLKGSTPASDRHRGLMDELRQAPEITVVASVDAGWFRQTAETVFDSLLAVHPDIDLVFAHNDRMAAGAYEAAHRQGRHQNMRFVGIDALMGEGYGIELVRKGMLDATFIYPTGGDRIVQTAMQILTGKPFERTTLLSTALVTSQNARILQMQTEHIATLDRIIEQLQQNLDTFLTRYSLQRMVLFSSIAVMVLVCILLLLTIRAFRTKQRLNMRLSRQKAQLEEQRDQLIALSQKLEEATHAKLAFFTNVSHDFRTPLTLIADPVKQLLTSQNLNREEQFLLQIVHKNVSVLLRLVNQILDFRKFESGKLNLHLSRFNLSTALHEWCEAFRTLAYRKHIQFHVDTVAPDLTVTADREKMERILYNLLSNAFKFTPANGRVCVELAPFTRDDASWFRLCVTDTGIGMPAEHVQHIFENFYQIDVHHAGSGIGLALVKAFVEMHRGNIQANSHPGKGTTFQIEVPADQTGQIENEVIDNPRIKQLQEGAILAAEQENINTGTSKENRICDQETVLIIDDNQDIRDYVRSVLQTQYIVYEAANGQEGIRQALKYVPDAIICDVMMPVMDGMECCRRLKSELQTSHIPVIMLTAYTLDEQKIKGYECGADSYLAKPFNADVLTARLKNLIENRKRLQSGITGMSSEKQSDISEKEKSFLEKLNQTIEKNLSNPDYNVETLGEQIGLSRVQLYRKTKALSGHAPNELLRIARLKRAATLLASTEKSIAEITYEVGFNSPSYFTKCYKEFFGENPTEFLKRKNN